MGLDYRKQPGLCDFPRQYPLFLWLGTAISVSGDIEFGWTGCWYGLAHLCFLALFYKGGTNHTKLIHIHFKIQNGFESLTVLIGNSQKV